MQSKNLHGFAVISLLISLIMVAVLVVIAITLYTRGMPSDTARVETPVQKSKVMQCKAQIRRLEIAVKVYYIDHDQNPATLSALDGFASGEFYCPVTGKAYEYDPVTGKITCPDHH